MRISLTTLVFALLFAGLSTSSRAQFRSDAAKPEPALNTLDAMKGGDFFSNLLDPNRFSMHQSVSMSMVSSGFGSYGLSMFTNTFSYKASDNLFLSADVSAVYSPFSSFGKGFQDQMNGLYLTNARLDWKLGESTFMRLEYVGGPQSYGYNPFYNAYNPFTDGQRPSGTSTVPTKLPSH
jgi:hypothetical protein